MLPTRVRSLGVIGALAYATAALVSACQMPEYYTGEASSARGGKSSRATGGAAAASGDAAADGGSEPTGEGGDTSGELGGAATGAAGATTTFGVGGTTTISSAGRAASSGGADRGGTSTSGGGNGANSGIAGSGNSSSQGGVIGVGGTSPGGAAAVGGANTGGTTNGGRSSGGAQSAGRASTGGATGLGGASSAGGAAGAGRSSSGGAPTGGKATGGAATGGAATGGAATGGAATDPDLVLWYKFDDASGATTAADSSGNGRNGTLTTLSTGSAAYSTTHQVGTGSLNLTSSSADVGAYVVVPTSLQAMGATTAVTLAGWVYLKSISNWQRLFDFGTSSTTSYMFLAVQQNKASPVAPRFAISKSGNTNEQVIDMTTPAALSINAWHHLAVVLGTGTTYTGTLYIDGAAVGTNTAMTLRPSDLGASTNNWLGRSQFTTADPMINAYLDDFRIYKRALSAGDIATLYAVR